MIRFQTLSYFISRNRCIAHPAQFRGGQQSGMAGIHGGIGIDAPSKFLGIQGQSGRYELSVPIRE
jgi:hypothetical protein